MEVYQIHIYGRLHPDIGMDGSTSMVSHEIFLTKSNALRHVDHFKHKCTTPRDDHDINYLDSNYSKISIVELKIDAILVDKAEGE